MVAAFGAKADFSPEKFFRCIFHAMFLPNVIGCSRIRFANVAFVSGIALRLDAVAGQSRAV
ncbi:hypothetical protein QAA45_00040 [Bifidobacterium breve]|uniref:hypothetical protein n=1 Tax=Bifidobacterium breve TaxID=1685 RepID=UPI00046CF4C2|nr:hypothetical protein [Bifidobacterium breve]MDO8168280.1 hypothetical protein [Bifidobacterium breve]